MPLELEIVNDERLGLPSASAMPLYFACAGAYALIQQVEQQAIRVDDSSADSERGVAIHRASELGDVSDLDESDATLVERIRATEERLVLDWLSENGLTIHDASIQREVRIWVPNLYSTQLDTLVITNHHGLFVIDAKSGRKKVAPPVRNYQLRAQAVAASIKHHAPLVRTAIVQPLAQSYAVCEYSAEHLVVAYERIKERLQYIKQPDLPRTAGPHCEFCRARHVCPEAKRAMSVAIGAKSLNWDVLAPDDKVRLFKAASLAEDCAALIKAHIRKELSENPDAIPGLKKAPDQKPRRVSDPAGMAKLMVDTVCFEDAPLDERFQLLLEFVKKTRIPISAVIEYYREHMPGTQSKKEVEKFLSTMAQEFISHGHRSGAISVVEEES